MSQFSLTMSDVYKRLKKLNLDETFVRQVALPSWWNKELDNKPIAVLEATGHIAQRLNLDLKSLILEDGQPQFKPLPHTKFKYHGQTEKAKPTTAQAIASQVAEVVARATQLPFSPLPSDPLAIRQTIIEQYPQVTLYGILDYCWQHGIAVVYFNRYPQGTRKLAGMIQWVEEQYPVIVLSSGHTHPARLAFDLAHELGHLALGHVKEGILLDETLNQKSDDQEEQESNSFAAKLLVGNLDGAINARKFYNAKQLAKKVKDTIQKNNDLTVEPCTLAFNYGGYNLEYFAMAQKAAQHLDPDSLDGIQTINRLLEQYIQWDQLGDDDQDYLDQILEAKGG